MPSYTVHYSNAAGSPPIGEPVVCNAGGPDDAIRFAETHMEPVSFRPSVGDVRGFSISDGHGATIVPWRAYNA